MVGALSAAAVLVTAFRIVGAGHALSVLTIRR